MKLNPDCLRDVLLYLEDNIRYICCEDEIIKRTKVNMYTIAKSLSEHTEEDVIYSIEKLYEMKYIELMNEQKDNQGYIMQGNVRSITASGHQFLETIRPKSVWKETLLRLKKIGTMSLPALSIVSEKVTEEIISNPEFIRDIIKGIK